MGKFLDSVPFSGIIRIRDMMYSVTDPFRLDQGDVSFDAPDTVKRAMHRAIDDNHSHYLQTTGVPRLLALLAQKMKDVNGIPVESTDELMVTTGGIHALFIACQALLEPGDEVIIPDPTWPPCAGNITLSHAVPIPCPLHEHLGWRYDLTELEATITPRTRAIYINSPHNPTGGVLSRDDIGRIADLVRDRGLWLISDEAYEDVVFDEAEHVSPASLPGMYERTIPIYTFSKTYAMTGLRLAYVAVRDAQLRERMKKALFYTASNVASVVQYGGIGALEGSQTCIREFRDELQARRDLFYAGISEHAGGVLSGARPKGAFYAFLRIEPGWRSQDVPAGGSLSWAMAEYLISEGRIGCVPGVDFGAHGEGYIRFCFARERRELNGALESMHRLFASRPLPAR
ncbi:MAG: pyridoxal phosphate-dependent aminotransferase [Acidobacteria bacterium]|nr:pyridoxal phosphate-dependent aminotransferase [Acidobacteriota bacterium]MCA1651661.1 pyridoxal phosphate-dependent aminotransferase [Acidobacteriota bacterium]